MVKKIIAVSLFAATAGSIALWDYTQNAVANTQVTPPIDTSTLIPNNKQQAAVEVVFVLDTTGSMSGLIQAAKDKIWSIASTMASAQNAPTVKMGLVAYRDRGDAYVTKVIDLSEDLDTMYAQLMSFHADGGGDTPESVNQALFEAVHKISWSHNSNSYKVVFLVGDAPPHMDYANEMQYPQIVQTAKSKGIVVNAIQCGQLAETTPDWQRIASLGSGEYFQVDQAGSAVAMSTPYDERLAALAKQLDDTRMYFGSKEVKEEKRKKIEATTKLHETASPESQARRAKFNASKSGKKNLYGEEDLVDAVGSGRVDLKSIDKDQLPAELQNMPVVEQQKLISKTKEKRADVERQINELSGKRDAYIGDELKKRDNTEESLEEKIYSAVREQGASVGLVYEAEKADY